MESANLPLPRLSTRAAGAIEIITDDALARASGVRVAFTARAGGVSEGAYEGLNLASHVGDDPSCVEENRRLLLEGLGAPDAALIVPHQVHGTRLVTISSAGEESLSQARSSAGEGADALLVATPGVAALLCFADCVPVIVVAPTGSFAVIHAGWRGAVSSIASKGVAALAALEAPTPKAQREIAAGCNVYIGPHIRGCCFETGPDVRQAFFDAFGPACASGERNLSLAAALAVDLQEAGIDPNRIVDANVCTACGGNRFYSYRASGGTCGRHGAVAFREA